MDPSYLWRFPVLMIRVAVRRFGWKVVLAGWGASTLLAVWLNYHY